MEGETVQCVKGQTSRGLRIGHLFNNRKITHDSDKSSSENCGQKLMGVYRREKDQRGVAVRWIDSSFGEFCCKMVKWMLAGRQVRDMRIFLRGATRIFV